MSSHSTAADYKIKGVSAAMSNLVKPISRAISEGVAISGTALTQLDKATAALSTYGIEVNITSPMLEFRFDPCDGFSGAWRRIKEVQSQLAQVQRPDGRDGLRARLFVSDIGLLTCHPPRRTMPDGFWQVDGDAIYFSPGYFWQYSLQHESSLQGVKDRSATVTYHLAGHTSKARYGDLGHGWGVNWGTLITFSHNEDPEVLKIRDDLEDLMRASGNSDAYETAFMLAGEPVACRVLDSAMREGFETIRSRWAEKGWSIKSAGSTPLPEVLSPDWKVKSAETRAARSARNWLGPVDDDDGKTSIFEVTE